MKVLSSGAVVKGKSVAVSLSFDKSMSSVGSTVVKLKVPKNVAYKSVNVSLGSAKFNKKTKVLTWTVANSALAKKNATVKMSLKAGKKGSYKISPSISSIGNKVTGKKDIKFKIK